MSANVVYLVTGANRGIGKGLLADYLSRPNNTVVATVRDPTSASSKALASLPTGKNSSLIVVKLDSSIDSDAQAAVEVLKSKHNISHLDIVIANAGIAKWWGQTANAPVSEFRDHFEINTVGTVTLFQATWPLLEKAAAPKFAYISTVVGSIGDAEKWPLDGVVYGASKAAMNYVVRKIHLENKTLTIFPIHPGWVQTDMGNEGAVANGLEQAPVTLEQSIKGLTAKIDSATRESASGKFLSFDEEVIGW